MNAIDFKLSRLLDKNSKRLLNNKTGNLFDFFSNAFNFFDVILLKNEYLTKYWLNKWISMRGDNWKMRLKFEYRKAVISPNNSK